MMYNTGRFKLGVFVVCGVVLFVVAISLLGAFDALKDKAYLMTMVSESVQGLSAGSAVKFQGVPIGMVNDITINTEKRLIRIDMEINLAKFKTDKNGDKVEDETTDREFYSYLKEDIERGLRCTIEPDGITGAKFVELAYVDPARSSDANFYTEPAACVSGYFYVPSVPSIMSDLRAGISGIIAKLDAVDYKGVSDTITKTFHDADAVLTDKRIENIIENIDKTSSDVSEAARVFRNTINGDRMNEIAESVKKALAVITKMAEVTTGTAIQLNDTLDTITEFVEYLNTDPSSVIHGKQKAGSETLLRIRK